MSPGLTFPMGRMLIISGQLTLFVTWQKKEDNPITIMQDLQGPKIRVGKLPDEGIMLKTGTTVVFSTNKKDSSAIPVGFPALPKQVKRGERILLDDGLIEVKVSQIKGNTIYCKIINGGLLFSHKGMNLPDSQLTISALTEKDKRDAAFGVQQGVDYIALSFVRAAKDVRLLRRLITAEEKKLKKKHPVPTKIIVKIEKGEAVEHFDEILKEADGVMVARGDLGVELPAPKVPIIQKDIIQKCLDAAKPVIVATQMLDSMIRNPRPTRAEVSDVANAVIDHADAVMLSGESATGKYPVRTVQMMTSIIEETENSEYDDFDFLKAFEDELKESETALSSSAAKLAAQVHAKAILVASLSGNTARVVSRYRPELPILVTTESERVRRQTNLSWGVKPFVMKPAKNVDELVAKSIMYIRQKKFIKKGDRIIIIAGQPVGKTGRVNWVKVHEIE